MTVKCLILLVILGGGGWLLTKIAPGINGARAMNIFAAGAILLVAILFIVVLRKLLAARRAKRIQQSLLKKVFAATHKHLPALVRKRMQLVQPDAYGNQKAEKWTDEIRYFLPSEHLDHLYRLMSKLSFL